MAEEKHTPGPWAWFGNASSHSLYLATTHSGRRYVMDFTRWGMRGAQPRFQPSKGGMIDAKDLLQFEVGDRSIVGIDAAKKDTSVYRKDVRSINSADARLIASSPDHALILWAMCVGAGRWEPLGDGSGEFCMNGLRHLTTLDEFGCPAMTKGIRDAIRQAGGQP